MSDTSPARSLVETVAAKFAEFLECAAARDLKAPLCMDDGMCSCRRDSAFIVSALFDAIAEPSDAMTQAACDVTIGPDPCNRFGATYANGAEATDIWRAMIAELRKEIENG